VCPIKARRLMASGDTGGREAMEVEAIIRLSREPNGTKGDAEAQRAGALPCRTR